VIAHDGAARLDGSQPDVADDDDRFDWLVVQAPDQPAAVSVMHAFEAVESGWGVSLFVVAGVGHPATARTALTVVTAAIVDEQDDAPR